MLCSYPKFSSPFVRCWPELKITLVSFACVAGFMGANPASAMGLDEIFDKALVQSEILQSAKLDIGISAAERERALNTQRPRISLNADGSYTVSKPDRDDWNNTW